MKQVPNPLDDKLSGLLKAARPTGEVAPGFQNRVWQRIEKAQRQPDSLLDRLARWVVVPRVAFGALAAVVVLAASLGAMHGTSTGMNEAKDRYMASVDPSYVSGAAVKVK